MKHQEFNLDVSLLNTYTVTRTVIVMSREAAKNILRSISKFSWDTRNTFPKGHKFISTYGITNSIQEPKDWNEIASKCSTNSNHEYYGKSVDYILEQWKSRADSGANRGNVLDEYIQAKLEGEEYVIPEDSDKELLDKIEQFDIFYNDFLKKDIKYVGSEIWLTSKKGISCRLDALFIYLDSEGKTKFLIIDWKNTNNIKSENRFNKLLGPVSNLDECELVLYTIQTFVYRYILEEYGYNVGSTRIIQITADDVIPHKPPMKYSTEAMDKLIEWTKQAKNND